jgi:uncharacterized protein
VTSPVRSRAEGVIIVGAASLLVWAFWFVSDAAGRTFDSAVIEAMTKLTLWGAVVFPMALWLARRRDLSVAEAFGLGGGVWRGVGFGLAATIPMIAALFLSPLQGFQPDLAMGSGIIGPFAEELLFRGFLFGLLWRVAGWPIPVSILASALLFGLAHDGDILGTALPLAAGGAVLAWIAWKWNSLWPAIALHACMNLWWDATRGEHVVPGVGPDLMSTAQLLSVAVAVGLTLRFSRSATSGSSGASGEWSGLSPVNDLQLRIFDKFQAPRT